MTDKQIIIDGVDVSGCGWYTQGATGMICADWHISNDCSKNPNCYYKQLKRKEQECEDLKEQIKANGFGCFNIEMSEQLDQLKAEIEDLKEAIRKDFCTHYVLGECSQEHHNNCVGMRRCIKDLEQENEKLKVYKSITPLKVKMLVKTLTDIKDCFDNYEKEQDYLSFVNELNQILQNCEVEV